MLEYGRVNLDNVMKRSSRVLEIFRELSFGVRQWLKEFELALEQPAEYSVIWILLVGWDGA